MPRMRWRARLAIRTHSAWAIVRRRDGALVAVVPRFDLVEHDALAEDCVCGPTPTLERPATDTVPDGWMLRHHALDGRP